MDDAIRIWKIDSAYASFEEDIKVSIETGKLADFVILFRNPLRVVPNSIVDIDVEKHLLVESWSLFVSKYPHKLRAELKSNRYLIRQLKGAYTK